MKKIFPDSDLILSDAEKQNFQTNIQQDLTQNRQLISQYLENLSSHNQKATSRAFFETGNFSNTKALAEALINQKVAAGEIEASLKEAFLNKLYNDVLSELLSLNSDLANQIKQRETQLKNGLTTVISSIKDLNTLIQINKGLHPSANLDYLDKPNLSASDNDKIKTLISPQLIGQLNKLKIDIKTLSPSKKNQIKEFKNLQDSITRFEQVYNSHVIPYRSLIVDPSQGYDPNLDGVSFVNKVSSNITLSSTKTLYVEQPTGSRTYSHLRNDLSGSRVTMFSSLHNNYLEAVLRQTANTRSQENQAFLTELESRFATDMFGDTSNFSGLADVNTPNYFPPNGNLVNYINDLEPEKRKAALTAYINHILNNGVSPLPSGFSPHSLRLESPFTQVIDLKNLTALAQRTSPPLTQAEKDDIKEKHTTLDLQLKIYAQSQGINIQQSNWKSELANHLFEKIRNLPDINKDGLETSLNLDQNLEDSQNEYARICAEKANWAFAPSTWWKSSWSTELGIPDMFKTISLRGVGLIMNKFSVPQGAQNQINGFILKQLNKTVELKTAQATAEEQYRHALNQKLASIVKEFRQQNGNRLNLQQNPNELAKLSLESAKFIVEQQKKRLEKETEYFYKNSSWAKIHPDEGFGSQLWRYAKHNSLSENALTISNKLIKAIPAKVKFGGLLILGGTAIVTGSGLPLLIPAGMTIVRLSSYFRDKLQGWRRKQRSSTASSVFLPKSSSGLAQLFNNVEKHIAAEQAFVSHTTRARQNQQSLKDQLSGNNDQSVIDSQQQYLKNILNIDTPDNSPYMKKLQIDLARTIAEQVRLKSAEKAAMSGNPILNSDEQEALVINAISSFLDTRIKDMHQLQEHYKGKQTRSNVYAIGAGSAISYFSSDIFAAAKEHILSPIADGFNNSIYNPLYESIWDTPAPGSVPAPDGVLPYTNNAPTEAITEARKGIFSAMDTAGNEALDQAESSAAEGARAARTIARNIAVDGASDQVHQSIDLGKAAINPTPEPNQSFFTRIYQQAQEMYQEATEVPQKIYHPTDTGIDTPSPDPTPTPEPVLPSAELADNLFTSNIDGSKISEILFENNGQFPSDYRFGLDFPKELNSTGTLQTKIAETYSNILGIKKDVLTEALTNHDHPLYKDLIESTNNVSDFPASNPPSHVLSGDSLNYLINNANTDYVEISLNEQNIPGVNKTNITKMILSPDQWYNKSVK